MMLEFADAASGIRGWIGSGAPGLREGETALLLFQGAEVLAAERSEDATLSEDGGTTRAQAKGGWGSLQAEVKPPAEAGPVSSGRATVDLTVAGKKRSFECPGAFGDLAGARQGDGDGRGNGDSDPELLRSLVALRDDGSALTLRSTLPRGGNGHGEEQYEAWLLEPDGIEPRRVDEPLLSTQYDEDGDQMRAGLELWIGAEDEVPLRGSGARACGTTLPLEGWSLRAAFFSWTIEGIPGSGSYMIWRAA